MTLPSPPVPPDADLRHLDDMPLEVRRLRDSGIAGVFDPESFRCGVLSWCTAWHQLPAGSLPSAATDLCRIVGLGRDMKTWRRIERDAMRGWRPFADGRLYHPVVTQKVINAWNGTLLFRWGKECDRIRKENKARAERKEEPLELPARPKPIPYSWPPDSAWSSDGNGDHSDGIPPEKRLKVREGKVLNKRSSAEEPVTDAARAQADGVPAEAQGDQQAPPPEPQSADATRETADQPVDDIDAAFAEWLKVAYALKIPDPGFLNGDRRRLLAACLAECGLERWMLAMENLRQAEWLRDDHDPSKPKRWVNLANVMKPETFMGLLENRYAEQHHPSRDRRPAQDRGGDSATATGIDAAFARRSVQPG